jgi:thioredoxin 1
MDFIFITIGILVFAFILFQILVFIKSKKNVGNRIPFDKIETEFIQEIKDKEGLIYFYSPTCGNCKVQLPIIEKVKNKINNLLSIDTSKHIKTAKAFNVMAIPSILFFKGNKIAGYYVGVKNEKFILEKLNNI